jgi:hypothetical protein
MKKVLYLLIFLSISSCSIEESTDFDKYKIIPNATDVNKFYNTNLDSTGKSETLTIKKWTHGPQTIEYKYDNLTDNKFRRFFYAITINIENNLIDSRDYFELTISEFKALSKVLTKVNLKGFNDAFKTDKRYYYSVRYLNKEPNGLLFVILDGKVTYSIVLWGFNSENDNFKFINDLVLPRLDKLGTLKLKT